MQPHLSGGKRLPTKDVCAPPLIFSNEYQSLATPTDMGGGALCAVKTSLPLSFLAVSLACLVLPGCAVVAAVDTTATIAIKTVGLAADATIGTARIAGKVVGAAADAALPSTPAPSSP